MKVFDKIFKRKYVKEFKFYRLNRTTFNLEFKLNNGTICGISINEKTKWDIIRIIVGEFVEGKDKNLFIINDNNKIYLTKAQMVDMVNELSSYKYFVSEPYSIWKNDKQNVILYNDSIQFINVESEHEVFEFELDNLSQVKSTFTNIIDFMVNGKEDNLKLESEISDGIELTSIEYDEDSKMNETSRQYSQKVIIDANRLDNVFNMYEVDINTSVKHDLLVCTKEDLSIILQKIVEQEEVIDKEIERSKKDE